MKESVTGCTHCGVCTENCEFLKKYDLTIGDTEKLSKMAYHCFLCGKCSKVCPQEIIHIHECANYIVVKCSNKSKGAAAKKQCEASCIGCGICEKTCTAGAVKVTDNCAVIDEDACLSCGMCSVKCPRHVIHDLRGIFTPVR